MAVYFRDVSAGSVRLNEQKWLLRVIGTDIDPGYLARLPVVNAGGEVLGEARPTVGADLGYGVIDAGMVEAAAYVLAKRLPRMPD